MPLVKYDPKDSPSHVFKRFSDELKEINETLNKTQIDTKTLLAEKAKLNDLSADLKKYIEDEEVKKQNPDFPSPMEKVTFSNLNDRISKMNVNLDNKLKEATLNAAISKKPEAPKPPEAAKPDTQNVEPKTGTAAPKQANITGSKPDPAVTAAATGNKPSQTTVTGSNTTLTAPVPATDSIKPTKVDKTNINTGINPPHVEAGPVDNKPKGNAAPADTTGGSIELTAKPNVFPLPAAAAAAAAATTDASNATANVNSGIVLEAAGQKVDNAKRDTNAKEANATDAKLKSAAANASLSQNPAVQPAKLKTADAGKDAKLKAGGKAAGEGGGAEPAKWPDFPKEVDWVSILMWVLAMLLAASSSSKPSKDGNKSLSERFQDFRDSVSEGWKNFKENHPKIAAVASVAAAPLKAAVYAGKAVVNAVAGAGQIAVAAVGTAATALASPVIAATSGWKGVKDSFAAAANLAKSGAMDVVDSFRNTAASGLSVINGVADTAMLIPNIASNTINKKYQESNFKKNSGELETWLAGSMKTPAAASNKVDTQKINKNETVNKPADKKPADSTLAAKAAIAKPTDSTLAATANTTAAEAAIAKPATPTPAAAAAAAAAATATPTSIAPTTAVTQTPTAIAIAPAMKIPSADANSISTELTGPKLTGPKPLAPSTPAPSTTEAQQNASAIKAAAPTVNTGEPEPVPLKPVKAGQASSVPITAPEPIASTQPKPLTPQPIAVQSINNQQSVVQPVANANVSAPQQAPQVTAPALQQPVNQSMLPQPKPVAPVPQLKPEEAPSLASSANEFFNKSKEGKALKNEVSKNITSTLGKVAFSAATSYAGMALAEAILGKENIKGMIKEGIQSAMKQPAPPPQAAVINVNMNKFDPTANIQNDPSMKMFGGSIASSRDHIQEKFGLFDDPTKTSWTSKAAKALGFTVKETLGLNSLSINNTINAQQFNAGNINTSQISPVALTSIAPALSPQNNSPVMPPSILQNAWDAAQQPAPSIIAPPTPEVNQPAPVQPAASSIPINYGAPQLSSAALTPAEPQPPQPQISPPQPQVKSVVPDAPQPASTMQPKPAGPAPASDIVLPEPPPLSSALAAQYAKAEENLANFKKGSDGITLPKPAPGAPGAKADEPENGKPMLTQMNGYQQNVAQMLAKTNAVRAGEDLDEKANKLNNDDKDNAASNAPRPNRPS